MTTPAVSPEMTREALGGVWKESPGPPSKADWINARSDSRLIVEGDVFVAIPGARTDGHAHLEDARLKGAVFAVVQRPVPNSPLPQLVVADTVLALRGLATLALEAHRRMGHRLVTLTGSVGKTTTRELVRRGLVAEGGVHASQGNENNEIGVPLTLLSWPKERAHCVLEAGVRKTGDIDYLAPLLKADVGIVTAIAPGHLENLGSVESVWGEKSKLLREVLPGGTRVLPEPVRRSFGTDSLFGDHSRTLLLGSIGEEPTLPGTVVAHLRSAPGMILHVEEWGVDLPLSRPSLALAWCSLLALITLRALGVPPAEGAARLAGYEGLPGRMERKVLPSGLLLLLDHYNANPASMREALDWLARERTLRPGSRSFAILGDMLELGEESGAFHEASGRQAARTGIDRIWYRGMERPAFERGFRAEGGDPDRIRDAEEFARDLGVSHGPEGGDILLVKGSRGMKLEEVVAPLLEGI